MDKLLSVVTGLTAAVAVPIVTELVLVLAQISRGEERHLVSLGDMMSVLGGPLGRPGGVGVVVLIAVAFYLAQEVINRVFARLMLRGYLARLRTPEEVASAIGRRPISRGLKRALRRAAARRLAKP
jgi:hypothetical protein